MPANKKAFFPSIHTALIRYRKVTAWDKHIKEIHPYFDTWNEAHRWISDIAKKRLKRAEKELAAAKRHAERVEKMTNDFLVPIITPCGKPTTINRIYSLSVAKEKR